MIAETDNSTIGLEQLRLSRLSASMVVSIALFQLLQFGIFLAYALPFRFFHRYALPFAVSSVIFHGILLYVLVLFRNDFVKEPGGEKLYRVNLANLITLFRISTLPTILFIILASKDYPIRYPLIVLVAVVFFTDFLDGYVSRKIRDKTRVGRMMDSASDYTLLFVISIVYYYFHLVPLWFFAVLAARLAGQTVMVLVVLGVKKRVTARTTPMGKATVASTMVLYALELARFVTDLPPLLYTVAEIAVGAVVAVSIADKLIIMAKDLKAPPAAEPAAGRLDPGAGGDIDADKERARNSAGTNQGPQGRP